MYLIKITRRFIISVILTLSATASQSATHYECFDKNFNAITMNFVVDGKDVYVATRSVFEPRKHFNDPTTYWKHLGNGRFKHKLLDGITKCKKTNIKYEKPKRATPLQAINLCHSAIRNDHKALNRKLPKNKDKYTLLTPGEFKQSEYDSKYGNVVIEVKRKGWFLGGLYLAVCQVDLTDHEAFVNVFDKVDDVENLYHGVRGWYTVKNTHLVPEK